MSRIQTDEAEPTKPTIESEEVLSFFEERARRISSLGPVRAVLYQDNHPDLAERRDAIERETLAPLIGLADATRFLDVGCGTGRWVKSIAEGCYYHGVDISPGLIDFARSQHPGSTNRRFSVCKATDLALAAIGEEEPFDRVLCAGLFIYLNDDELVLALRGIAAIAAPTCRVMLREPMAMSQRLTLQNHYSEDMQQTYNAIYRTQRELLRFAEEPLLAQGFRFTVADDLFADPDLNNRAETRQRWLLLERNA